MKKLLIPCLILAASSAYAGDSSKVLTSGTSTQISNDANGCLILSSGVSVGLSANVSGAVFCSEADAGTVSMIAVGTCHSGGLTRTRDVTCSRTGEGTAESPYVYSPSTCSATNFPEGGNPTTVSYTGPSMFSGNTATGGGVVEGDIDGVCNGGNILTEITPAS